jgi:hypothetical protein
MIDISYINNIGGETVRDCVSCRQAVPDAIESLSCSDPQIPFVFRPTDPLRGLRQL